MSALRARAVALAVLGGVAFGAAPTHAVELVGASFATGLLYDVDATTGAATNPRPIELAACAPPCSDPPGAATFVAGIEVDFEEPETLLGATTLSNPDFPSTLFAAPIADPLAPFDAVFSLAQQVGEGDLALAPDGAALYAIGLTNTTIPFTLLRIPRGEDAVVVGELGTSDVSGLAFSPDGTLYALDTGADVLRTIDPLDAATLASVPLSQPLGAVAGMDFDADGTLWVADGGTGGTNSLYTLDPDSGALTTIGPLGLASGLSGLAVVPEPGAAAAAAIALCALAAGRRSKSRR
jgi:hypothetical protein